MALAISLPHIIAGHSPPEKFIYLLPVHEFPPNGTAQKKDFAWMRV